MNPVNTTPTAWTRKSLAAALGITERTVDALVRSGKIPAPIKLGHRTTRWPANVVERLLNGGQA